MNWELIAPWLNRAGIILEFMSFWFAAPEILGAERLKEIEVWVKSKLESVLEWEQWKDFSESI